MVVTDSIVTDVKLRNIVDLLPGDCCDMSTASKKVRCDDMSILLAVLQSKLLLRFLNVAT